MLKKFKTISIIIPAFNEESFIQEILQKVIRSNTLTLKKEIIIVDDKSDDQTLAKIKKIISKTREKIILIEKKVNEGKGAALKLGFIKSMGDIILIQDADLEYSPDDYPILIEPFLKNNADVVYGSRFISTRPRRVLYFWHFVGNTFLTALSNIFTDLSISDMETGFKAFEGRIIRKLAPGLKSKRFGFEPEITAKISKIKDIKIYEVGIAYQGRTYSQGKKIRWTDGLRAIWEIIKYNLLDR